MLSGGFEKRPPDSDTYRGDLRENSRDYVISCNLVTVAIALFMPLSGLPNVRQILLEIASVTPSSQSSSLARIMCCWLQI